MKLLYVMSHPSDRLEDERAGHVVRPRQLLQGLRAAGVETAVVEAASSPVAQAAASSYRGARERLPAGPLLLARDAVRVLQNERFARRALQVARAEGAEVLLETQVAFSTAGASVARRTGLPLVVDDVSPVEEDEEVYDVRLRALARTRRRRTLTAATLVLCSSAAIRDSLHAEGVPPERVAVLPNGVPSAAAQRLPADPGRRRALGLSPDHTVVAYVGSFQPFHRVGLLVEALARPDVPEHVRVLLVGDGGERAQVEALAQSLGVAHRVVAVGRVPSEDVAQHLALADAAVLPATADYTNPMKLYDYLAAGLPVVAPDQRAVRDVLGDVPAALFVPGSAADLARQLTLLAEDGALRERLAHASRGAGTTHSWDARARALLAELDRVRTLG